VFLQQFGGAALGFEPVDNGVASSVRNRPMRALELNLFSMRCCLFLLGVGQSRAALQGQQAGGDQNDYPESESGDMSKTSAQLTLCAPRVSAELSHY